MAENDDDRDKTETGRAPLERAPDAEHAAPETAGEEAGRSPPADLSALQQAFEQSDAEFRAAMAQRLRRRRIALVGLAALVPVVVGLGAWALRGYIKRSAPPPRVDVSGVFLSTREDVLEGGETEFRARRLVYLHFTLDRPGWAFAALFGDEDLIQATSRVREVGSGHGKLRFRLDNPGTWSFLLLVSATPRTLAEFKALIGRDFFAPDAPSDRAQKLRAIVRDLRERGELSVEAVTFDLLPP